MRVNPTFEGSRVNRKSCSEGSTIFGIRNLFCFQVKCTADDVALMKLFSKFIKVTTV